MTIITGIAIDSEDFAVGQVLSHSTTPIRLTQFVPINTGLMPYFWKEINGDTEEFERQVRADERVESLTNLDGRVDAYLYSIEWTDRIDGFLSALEENNILVEEGRTTDGGDRWLFRLRAWNQEDLTEFQNTCFEHDVPLDIRRVFHNPDQGPTDTDPLTAPQREAVVVALRKGYFDIPRGHSQEEIAAELGISRQAFSRRLRRAQKSLFEDQFWEELVGADDA